MEALERKIDAIAEAMQKGFLAITDRLVRIEYRVLGLEQGLHENNRRLGNVEIRLESIDERLETLEQAFDRDAERIVAHGKRIVRLEKAVFP